MVEATISVAYGSKSVTDGLKLSKQETSSAPDVRIQASDDTLTSLLMTDSDAPSHETPKMAEWLHWMMTNITAGDVSSGMEVMAYAGPSPPPGTGKHRYIFTVYAQQGPIEVVAPSSRAKFNSKDFAASHHLTPLTSVHFLCQTHA